MTKPHPADDEPTLSPTPAPLPDGGQEPPQTNTWTDRTSGPGSMDAEDTFGLVPGMTFGPYHIESCLGQGGMGAVYKGVHARLNKVMAIKVLSGSYTQDPEAVRRFEREMRAVGTLSHPNIVQAHDAGEVQGIHYLAMEYVEGADLHDLVRQKGPLSVPQACKAIRQAALALGAAHQAGLVHRDVKPSNLFLARSGQVKLLDLGLARLADEAHAGAPLTGVGQMFGTPDYMAPEQWENVHEADGRADLYALGCTLFYLLTGRPPYGDTHRSAVNKMKGHMLDAVPDLKSARADVPNEVVAIYNKLMAKHPQDRYQTGAELAQALQKVSAPDGPAEKAKPTAATPKAKPDDQQQRRDAAALLQLAQQLIARYDYAEAVRTLEQIPPRHRSEAVQTTLTKTSDILSELQELQVDIDQALAQKNFVALKTGVKRYLELHPGHARMKALWKRIQTYGNKPAVFLATAEATAGGGASWVMGIGLAAGVLLLLAGGTYWLTQSTLDATKPGSSGQPAGSNDESNWKVVLQVDDPTAKVVIDGEPVTLSGQRTELMLQPGKHLWTASASGASSQSGTFEVRRQQTTGVTITLRGTPATVVKTDAVPSPFKLAEFLASPDWEWSAPESLGPDFAGPKLQWVYGLTDDERELLCYIGGQMMLSRRADRTAPFGPPQPIESITVDVANGATLLGDGLLIIFVKNDPQTGSDLWYAFRPDRDAPFGAPIRLDEPVSSAHLDRHPILSGDGLTLLLTSNRPGSSGGGDIWMATRTALNVPFDAPARLDAPVNTDGFDIPSWIANDRLVLCARHQQNKESRSRVWMRNSVDEPFVEGPPLSVWPNEIGSDMWLSPDGRRIYFCAQPEGTSRGDRDIMTAQRVPRVGATPPATDPDDSADLVMPTGKFALQFDGVDDVVEIPSLRFDGSHPLTVETWILGEGPGTAWVIGGTPLFRLSSSENDWRALRILPDGTATGITAPRRYTKKFVHLCLTVDGDECRLFFNGRPHSGSSGRGRFPAVAGALSSLGGNPRTAKAIDGGYFTGQIRGFRVSKTVRYTDMFRPPAQLENDADTLALYLLDEGMGETVKDASGHGHDGKIVGATWVQPTAGTNRRAQK